jgi:hypothetical protein
MIMTFKRISLFFIAALTTCSIQAQQVQLIPEPSSIQIGNGTFKLPNAISIQVASAFEEIGKKQCFPIRKMPPSVLNKFKTIH